MADVTPIGSRVRTQREQVLRRLLEATGYLDLYDKGDQESQTRLENIREFLSAAQEFAEQTPGVPPNTGSTSRPARSSRKNRRNADRPMATTKIRWPGWRPRRSGGAADAEAMGRDAAAELRAREGAAFFDALRDAGCRPPCGCS